MQARILRLGGLLLLGGIALSGCDLIYFIASTPDPAMSKEAVATREASPENIFDGELAGERMVLLLHDCEVYRVERGDKGAVRWESVVAPDLYPFWTACQRQGMWVKDGAMTVTFGRMAVGAGGCCATGGTYRSVDGRTWKKISENTLPRDPSAQK